jgi:hypothetical protein
MDAQTIEPRSKPVERHCRRCDAVLYVVETMLDPRTRRVVRMYKCECGERIWDGWGANRSPLVHLR